MIFFPPGVSATSARADALAVGLAADELDAEPVPVLAVVAQELKRARRVRHGDVRVAVVVVVGDGRPAADERLLEGRAARPRAEVAGSVVPHQHGLLRGRGSLPFRAIVDVAVRHERVEVSVVLDVEQVQAELHVRQRRWPEAGRHGEILEDARSEVAVVLVGLPLEVGHDDVGKSVSVDVAGVDPHASLGIAFDPEARPRSDGDVLELPAAEVVEQVVHDLVVGDVEVGLAVEVEVDEENAEALADGLAEARLARDVGERSVAVVAIQRAQRAVIHDRRAVVALARLTIAAEERLVLPVVRVLRHEEVEIAVAVDVRPGRAVLKRGPASRAFAVTSVNVPFPSLRYRMLPP